MRQRIAFFLILFFLFLTWLWVRDGISPDLVVQKKAGTISVIFDNQLLGQANDVLNDPKMLRVTFSAQDLNTDYFFPEQKADHNDINLSAGNYRKNIKLRNPFAVRLIFEGNAGRYVFFFNPYRHLNAGWEDPENLLQNTSNSRVKISTLNGIKWMLWILLKPFWFVFVTALLIAIFLRKLKFNHKQDAEKKRRSWIYWAPIILLALISFCWSRYLMVNYLDDVTHVPDAVSYIIQAKLLASGQFVMPFSEIPKFIPVSQYGEYFNHWFVLKDNFLYIYYYLGHPIILALGQMVGLMNYIPPLVGALTLISVYLATLILTRSLIFSFISSGLILASPFFQTQTVDFMSHNTAAFYLIISILPILADKPRWYLLTGFFQGMLLNTRPLTFVATFGIIAFFEILIFFKNKKVKDFLTKICWGLVGAVLPLGILFYYNWLTTNNIFSSPYLTTGILNKAGLGSEFQWGYGLLQGFSNLAVFSLFFLKNYYVSFFPLLLSLVLLPFYGKNLLKIFFLQLLFLSVIFTWTLYDGNFFMYGPRFIYETVPVLTILYGTTFYYLLYLFKNHAWRYLSSAILIFYFFQIFLFEQAWFGIRKSEYQNVVFVPSNIQELKLFNEADGRLKKIQNKYLGQDHVLLMRKCVNSIFSWQCEAGHALNSFPLSNSKPLFLTMPDDYRGEINNAEILNYENL